MASFSNKSQSLWPSKLAGASYLPGSDAKFAKSPVYHPVNRGGNTGTTGLNHNTRPLAVGSNNGQPANDNWQQGLIKDGQYYHWNGKAWVKGNPPSQPQPPKQQPIKSQPSKPQPPKQQPTTPQPSKPQPPKRNRPPKTYDDYLNGQLGGGDADGYWMYDDARGWVWTPGALPGQ